MERSNLMALLESDREMIMAGISADRSPAAAQAVLEKAFGRLMLRAAEQCPDAASRDAAQLVLSTLRSALPLVDSVSEVRRWSRTVAGDAARKPGALAWAAVIAGAALVLGSVLALAIAGARGILTPIRALIPAILGLAAVFFGGTKFARPASRKAEAPEDVRDEFLVDPERVWRHLRSMALLADSALDGVASREAAARQRAESQEAAGPIDRAQAELFAGLLENAYAQGSADAREMVESIRFYLHGAGVDVVDCESGRENWFEYLPAQRTGTIRPALAAGDRLIKKGLASA